MPSEHQERGVDTFARDDLDADDPPTEDPIPRAVEAVVERVEDYRSVWSPWVADVTGAGFVLAGRTHAGDPPFPFDLFAAQTGVDVERAHVDLAGMMGVTA